jgi:hypothetical protein
MTKRIFVVPFRGKKELEKKFSKFREWKIIFEIDMEDFSLD